MDSQEQSLEVSSGTSSVSQETFGRLCKWITYHSLCLKWITNFFLQLPSQMEKNTLIKDLGKTFFFTWKNILFPWIIRIIFLLASQGFYTLN